MQQLATNQVALEFYTPSRVLSGYVPCPTGLRLLDLLNGVVTREPETKGEFLEFYDTSYPSPECSHPDETREYVRKAAIEMVAVSDANLARGIGARGVSRLYPFVEKAPVRVSLELPSYSLVGNVHCVHGQGVHQVLNEDASFLPLTDVSIAHQYSFYGTRPFVAVNKEHIISSREEKLN